LLAVGLREEAAGMMRTVTIAVGFLTVFASYPGVSQPAQQSLPTAETQTPKADYLPTCLGATVTNCRANFKIVFGLKNEEAIDADITYLNKKDVNGRKISTHMVQLFPVIATEGETMIVTLTLNDRDLVRSVDVMLPENPGTASTEEDYDKTYIFQTKQAVLGSECDGMDKISVYRFFQNRIKPSVSHSQAQPEFWDTGVETDHIAKSKHFPFCGHTVSYRRDSGIDTSLINSSDYSGRYNSNVLTFR
jgi:hypothetical protein